MSERASKEDGPARRAPLPAALAPDAAQRASPRVRLLNVGYGNRLVASRIVAIVSPQSSPMRRLRRDAARRGKLVDTTEGRRTRSILITDSDHVVLSAIHPETIAARLAPEPSEAGGD